MITQASNHCKDTWESQPVLSGVENIVKASRGKPSGTSWETARQTLAVMRSVPSLWNLRPGPLSKVCRVRTGYPMPPCHPRSLPSQRGRRSSSPCCWWESKHKHQILRTRACMCSLGRNEPQLPQVGSRLHSLQVWPAPVSLQACRARALDGTGGFEGWPASDRQLRRDGQLSLMIGRGGGYLFGLARRMDTRVRTQCTLQWATLDRTCDGSQFMTTRWILLRDYL